MSSTTRSSSTVSAGFRGAAGDANEEAEVETELEAAAEDADEELDEDEAVGGLARHFASEASIRVGRRNSKS